MRNPDLDRLHWMDYGLSALGGCLAVYSMGMGLSTPEIGYLLMGVLLLGTIVSFAVHRFASDKATYAGGALYAVLGFVCFLNARGLNRLLPGEGVPEQLLMAGVLAWMITLGSFTLWRDTTIIFQAVPTIALFGLVGTWDTFAAAPFAFFGFLLCFAILFARAHGRLMMRQADDSGVVEETGDSLLLRLKSGPWRWMAGPEWALGSALAVILLSVLGAPVLQQSVQGVVEQVKVTAPRPPQSQAQNTPLSDPWRGSSREQAVVGSGPRNLRNRVVFRTNLQKPYHLRAHTYDQYTGRGWRVVPNFSSASSSDREARDPDSLLNAMRIEAVRYDSFNFMIRFEQGMYESLPYPGEVDGIPDSAVDFRQDGTLGVNRSIRGMGLAVRLPAIDGATGKSGLTGLDGVFSDKEIRTTNRVKDFARNAIKGAKSDVEKANMLKAAIENQAGYDLQAAAIPAGEDVVDHFLFTSKRGPCDLFASAMVATARSVGLTARYATGFFPARGVKDQYGLILHESEAHAWGEIYLQGVGWVPFDPTEGAPDLGRPTVNESLLDQQWVRTAAIILAGFLIVLGPAGFRYLSKGKAEIPVETRKLGRAYGTFVRSLERATGKPKRPGQTPTEYLAVVGPMLGAKSEVADQLNAKFVESLYSGRSANADSLLVEARHFGKELRSPRKR